MSNTEETTDFGESNDVADPSNVTNSEELVEPGHEDSSEPEPEPEPEAEPELEALLDTEVAPAAESVVPAVQAPEPEFAPVPEQALELSLIHI